MYNADKLIELLELVPHPEGGYFREIYKSGITFSESTKQFENNQNLSTSIYFMLKETQVSLFHRLKSDEIWYFHFGSPLRVYFINQQGNLTVHLLGLDIKNGQKPQLIIPAGTIFGAEVIDKKLYTLLGCMVSPGFSYSDFKLFKRDELMARYPEYSEVICKLTKQ